MQENKPTPALLDVFLTGAAARTEHYEIAAYTGLIDQARALGEREAVELLQENLKPGEGGAEEGRDDLEADAEGGERDARRRGSARGTGARRGSGGAPTSRRRGHELRPTGRRTHAGLAARPGPRRPLRLRLPASRGPASSSSSGSTTRTSEQTHGADAEVLVGGVLGGVLAVDARELAVGVPPALGVHDRLRVPRLQGVERVGGRRRAHRGEARRAPRARGHRPEGRRAAAPGQVPEADDPRAPSLAALRREAATCTRCPLYERDADRLRRGQAGGAHARRRAARRRRGPGGPAVRRAGRTLAPRAPRRGRDRRERRRTSRTPSSTSSGGRRGSDGSTTSRAGPRSRRAATGSASSSRPSARRSSCAWGDRGAGAASAATRGSDALRGAPSRAPDGVAALVTIHPSAVLRAGDADREQTRAELARRPRARARGSCVERDGSRSELEDAKS